MPTYIQGDIPVGNLSSGQLILKNVVIETATPYKPPTEGGPRDTTPCFGDKCAVNRGYVPSPNERAVLLNDVESKIATVDGPDMPQFIDAGWKLIGIFDPRTADVIADRLAANPPVSNEAVQRKRWETRLIAMGPLTAGLPLGMIRMMVSREKMLKDDVNLGRIPLPDPQKAKAVLADTAAGSEQGWKNANAITDAIDGTLATVAPITPSAQYIKTYLLVPQNVETGGMMGSFMSMVRRPDGTMLPINLANPDEISITYVYPPYRPEDFAVAQGRKIVAIVRTRTTNNPNANAIYNRVNEWNANNPNQKIVTSTFGG